MKRPDWKLQIRARGKAASVNNGPTSRPYPKFSSSASASRGASLAGKLVVVFGSLLASVLFSNSAYADTPTLSFSTSSASNGGVVEMETLAPTSTSGAYTSGSDTLSITTTCSAGHSVYVSATSDNSYGTSLTNEDKTSSIPTGSFTLGSSGLGNIWGIRYGSGNDYIALPAYSSDISGDITPIYTGTNTTIPIYYGINVTPALAPGEYSGKVLYTVMMNRACTTYTVKYDKNANDATGTMNNQTIAYGTYATSAVRLAKNTFERANYTFLGWSTDKNATTATYADEYRLAAELPEMDGEITLYAIWKADTETIVDEGYLGTMQSFVCETLGSNHTATLADSRDNQTYKVYRIPTDSKATNVAGMCIMTDDLRLGMVTSGEITGSSNLSLTTAKSNFESGSNDTTISYGSTETVKYVASSSRSSWSSTDSYTNKQYTYGSGDYAVGYYSWGAALVVCPAGWRLPNRTEYSDTSTYNAATAGIYYAAGNSLSTLMAVPWRFQRYTGSFYSGGFIVQGDSMLYWTSTQANSAEAYVLHVTASGARTSNAVKGRGRPVRCVQADTTMQNFDCSSLATGGTTTLIDARDGNTYSVLRLATSSTATSVSGKCIMTENLKLGRNPETGTVGNITVDSTTSNYETYASTGSTGENFTNSGEVTLTYRASGWASTNNYTNRQFYYRDSGTSYTYNTHGYYSWGAAIVACPKGWHLPTATEWGYSTGLFALVGATSSSNGGLTGATYKFPTGGGYYVGWLDATSAGKYWASTQGSSTDVYTATVGSSGTGLGYPSVGKSNGRNVRCISN